MKQTNLIAKLTKNALEEIRINLSHFQGKEFIDIRIWFLSNKGEFVPTKKGITIPKDKYPQFKEVLNELDKELTKKET